jgi:hypothetical protein
MVPGKYSLPAKSDVYLENILKGFKGAPPESEPLK